MLGKTDGLGLVFQEIFERRLAQPDGRLPIVAVASRAFGETGVFSARFHDRGHISVRYVCADLTSRAHICYRIADRALSRRPSRGFVALGPASADYAAGGSKKRASNYGSNRFGPVCVRSGQGAQGCGSEIC
jgi:hypothetical protein